MRVATGVVRGDGRARPTEGTRTGRGPPAAAIKGTRARRARESALEPGEL